MSRLPHPVPRIVTRQDAERLFAALATGATEVVAIAYLDRERSLLGLRHVIGHADSATVPVARIARDAILLSAQAILIAHNHPDGDPHPSAADLALTRRLAQGLDLLEVRLLDHLILAGDRVASLRDMGVI
ncbi:JAB domain-containing protein [Sphingomonas sp.]|uniref:JAB domain-containing protein n=1 Tax=Sphingomonas sp. TaxID=28214 RepID=UPI00289F475B|nr:JAB domain-containing protein [Sphingomonas sp.]